MSEECDRWIPHPKKKKLSESDLGSSIAVEMCLLLSADTVQGQVVSLRSWRAAVAQQWLRPYAIATF